MLTIGRNKVGQGEPTLIIAEVGSNWHTIEDCFASIDAAKRAGADVVKFQAYTFTSLYGVGSSMAPKGYSKDSELPMEWVPKLRNKCDSVGIDFMCTAFDPKTMRDLDQYVPAHKIASSDMNYDELLDTAVRLRKPVFLSTGGSTENAVSHALMKLRDLDVVLMYCVASYPATSVNLFVIDELKKFNRMVGFSDHTLDSTYLPLAACKNHGAVAIEKHFTIVNKDTPDAGHSLNELEFATMVDFIRGDRKARILPLPSEEDMLLKHKRRLIATKEIAEGGRLVLNENYGAYRSLRGDYAALPPHMAGEVNGIKVAKALSPGDGITAGHVRL